MRHNLFLSGLLIVGAICGVAHGADKFSEAVELAVGRANQNEAEIRRALVDVPAPHRQAMEFLVTNMPPRDLESLSADFLLENVELAYRAWQEAPWHEQISEEMFFNNILPLRYRISGRLARRIPRTFFAACEGCQVARRGGRHLEQQSVRGDWGPLLDEAAPAGSRAARIDGERRGDLHRPVDHFD
jgi:hypothetical protein